jgi:hypothetical protein
MLPEIFHVTEVRYFFLGSFYGEEMSHMYRNYILNIFYALNSMMLLVTETISCWNFNQALY